jgi:glycosyltransferase involved in cell wall biosynthesis
MGMAALTEAEMKENQNIWVVVPSFNEERNLQEVMPRIVSAVRSLGNRNRLLIVDDGSTDNSIPTLYELSKQYPEISFISLGRNSGKAAALRAGFVEASKSGAKLIAMMDADGQDDPGELGVLVQKINDGYDLVTGARLLRNDRFIKRSTSKIYNYFTAKISGVPGRDFNSGFKVMRSSVADDVRDMLYGELHRYLTVVAHWYGHKVTEVRVQHHQRLHGSSKYGVARFWRGLVDLITIKFIISFENRPSHFFGGLGALSLIIGTLLSLYLSIIWLLGEPIGSRPLLIAGVLFIIAGIQLILFGLLAELIVYGRNLSKRASS